MIILKTSKLAKKLGVSPRTIWNWIRNKKIRFHQNCEGGDVYFNWNEIEEDLGLKKTEENKRINIAYARISTAGQKEDLKTQEKLLEMFCLGRGYQFRLIKDVGSGINYKRKGFIELIELIEANMVSRVVVTYQDRIMRFGYEMFEQICKQHEVEIVIINQSKEISYEAELVQDVLTILTVFSSRIYGKRSHMNKKIIKENKELWKTKET